jgi:putative ABC transport system ATP-binding protein
LVTHDERVGATADRLLTMRDGAIVDETRLADARRPALTEITDIAEEAR